VVEALEIIGHPHIAGQCDYDDFKDWATSDASEAQAILASITSFEFIVTFLIVYQYLSHLSGITIQLQNSTLEIIEAYSMVGVVLSC
jgi:hypothetical protein